MKHEPRRVQSSGIIAAERQRGNSQHPRKIPNEPAACSAMSHIPLFHRQPQPACRDADRMVLVIIAEGGLAFDFPLASSGDRFVAGGSPSNSHTVTVAILIPNIHTARSCEPILSTVNYLHFIFSALKHCHSMSSNTSACPSSDKFSSASRATSFPSHDPCFHSTTFQMTAQCFSLTRNPRNDPCSPRRLVMTMENVRLSSAVFGFCVFRSLMSVKYLFLHAGLPLPPQIANFTHPLLSSTSVLVRAIPHFISNFQLHAVHAKVL